MKDFLDSGERNDTPSNEYLARENERISELESQVRELTAQRDKQRIGLEKINYIRQSIVGSQQVNWSEHIYPLVAALDEAGLVSLEYGEARNNFGQLFKRNQDLESQVAELRATVEKLERLRAEFIWLAHCPSRPTFCNCRAHVALEAELYNMRKGRFSLGWNYCGQAKPGDYVAERTREAWSAWQSSSSRLREGLRELAERWMKEAHDWDNLGRLRPDYEPQSVIQSCAREIRALLSLEGDKTGVAASPEANKP